jgi:V8-like Glu-specific endopeptidase
LKIKSNAAVALGLALCVACGPETDSEEETVGVTFEPIIGGTVATAYPEAAYLNIDKTAVSGYACSGALIAPQVVLTAGHCVDGHSRWEVHVGAAVQTSTSSAVYDWKENGATTINPKHHDIGLVFLSAPIKLASYPVLSKTKVPDNTKAINVGRVLNGVVQSGAYQAPTTLVSADKIGYPLDYTSAVVIQPGDSGGPVFLAGTHTIVAVNSGAGGNTQVLARVDLLADWLASQVAAHSGGAPASSGSGGSGGGGGAPSTGGSAGSGGAKSSGGAGGSGTAGATCTGTKEVEPNNAWTSANKLVGAACAGLGTATDADWYSVSVNPGSHVLDLAATGDAALTVGAVSGANCIASLSGVKRVNINVGGAAQRLCVKAASAGKKVQTYRLTIN